MEFCGILFFFFSESLNPNRLNPNQFAECCGFVYGILRNFAESLNPNRLNPNRLTADKSVWLRRPGDGEESEAQANEDTASRAYVHARDLLQVQFTGCS